MKKTAYFFLFLSLAILSSAFAEAPQQADLQAALEKGLRSYAAVNDYTALFQKKEKDGDALGPDETIFLKFEKPFKIFMKWLNTDKKGLQVLYERGKRDGKLAIHQPGLFFGLAQVVMLDQNSPWVREGSESYDIEDAGIGTFLEDFAAAVEKAGREGKLKVEETAAETFDVTFAGSNEDEGYFAYRVLVHFDAASALPDRMELFDWKDKPTGIYVYEHLKLNVGASDPEFKKHALGKLYRLYFPQKTVSSKNFSGKSPRAK